MTTLIVTIFLASLLGSLHCAGMCGAFVAFSVGMDRSSPVRHAALQSAYHGGRLVTYTLLGAAAGALGAAMDLTGSIFGLQRIALVVAGVGLVSFGVVTLLRLHGAPLKHLGVPRPLANLFARGVSAVRDRPPLVRALMIGLMTTLLPCGWLYAFAVTAAGTGSAGLGAVTMAVFWAGTLPVLVSIGLGIQALAGPLRRYAPTVTALALVVVGLVAIVGRFNVPAFAAGSDGPVLVSNEEAAARVRELDAERMPCCAGPDTEPPRE